jgi:hypothetical protein
LTSARWYSVHVLCGLWDSERVTDASSYCVHNQTTLPKESWDTPAQVAEVRKLFDAEGGGVSGPDGYVCLCACEYACIALHCIVLYCMYAVSSSEVHRLAVLLFVAL